MRRARLLLLLLLLPARAASLWALPRCAPVLVCHMGPEGGSCCPAGDCAMKECNGSGSEGALAPVPALPPSPSFRLAGPLPTENVVVQESSDSPLLSREVPHPPPRA